MSGPATVKSQEKPKTSADVSQPIGSLIRVTCRTFIDCFPWGRTGWFFQALVVKKEKKENKNNQTGPDFSLIFLHVAAGWTHTQQSRSGTHTVLKASSRLHTGDSKG